MPLKVKRWGHTVGRDEIDKFEKAIQREGKSRGVVVGFGFTKDAYEEVARAKNKLSLDIALKTARRFSTRLEHQPTFDNPSISRRLART